MKEQINGDMNAIRIEKKSLKKYSRKFEKYLK